MFRERQGWRVSWYVHGKRRTKKFKDEIEAKIFELKLKQGTADVGPSLRTVPTFEALALEWHESYCKVERSQTQWAHDLAVIKMHLVPVLGAFKVTGLRASHLNAVKDEMRAKRKKNAKPLSPRTINNAVGQAKKIMSWAVERGLIATNPFASVKMVKKVKQACSYWTPEERDQFIAAAFVLDPEFTDLVTVASHTGLRMGELAGLRIKDLDFKNGLIHVGRSYSVKLRKDLETVKNSEAGFVGMNTVVRPIFEPLRFKPPGERVFSLTLFDNARRRFGRLCDLVGARPIRFHDLRHTFASALAMAGVDLMKIQAACRHKSYSMTLRYAHLHPKTMQGVTEALTSETDGTQLARRG